MVYRLIIDVLRSIGPQSVPIKFVDPEPPPAREELISEPLPAVLVPVNRFVPTDFVFRCKAVRRD
jgi:hypothetical protein